MYADEANALDPGWLEPVGRKEFLARMLRNLKRIYAQKENDVMLFRTIHWLLALQPDAMVELRERALLYEAMGNPDRARQDWQRFMTSVSDFETEKRIRARIDYLKQQNPRIH
jgi:regulator of sirC expression with transglutaminase-like and TPR domain